MARNLKKKPVELKAQVTDDDQKAQVTDDDQKDLLDPATTAVVGTVAWFSFKAIAQAILGWIGLNYYLKMRKWWKNRGKVEGEKTETTEVTTEVSTEESAASS